jgi:hypothetical protein
MSPAAIAYLRELAARKSKAYELLLALEENRGADDSSFQNLAQIVDRVQFYEISLDGETLDGLRTVVKSETPDLASTIAVLASALSEAEPDRRSIGVLLAGYPKWLRAVSDIARPHFLGILPNIALYLKELDESGVDALAACLNLCPSAEDCEILAGCVRKYQETSGNIILAAAEIAGVAIRTDSRPLVEKLVNAVAPEATFDSKPARELLPALVGIKTAAAGEAVWSAAIGVCVAAAGDNHSSALNLARHLTQHLKGSLGSLAPETQLAYLKSFHLIVEEAGISLLGYGTKQLPFVFQEAGEERATEFVAQGIAIAHRYGRFAAEEFFEQKTEASKRASSLG